MSIVSIPVPTPAAALEVTRAAGQPGWAPFVLIALIALCVGYLAAAIHDRHVCVVCGRQLARVCAGGLCGGRPGLGDDLDNRLRTDRDVDEATRAAYGRGYVDALLASREAEEADPRD